MKTPNSQHREVREEPKYRQQVDKSFKTKKLSIEEREIEKELKEYL